MMLEGLGLGGRELTDPAWREWFDRLKRAGVTGLEGGASAPGSNQFRGTDVQPWYLSNVNTMFDSEQESAVTGRNFGEETLREASLQGRLRPEDRQQVEQHLGESLRPLPESLRGLKRARGRRY